MLIPQIPRSYWPHMGNRRLSLWWELAVQGRGPPWRGPQGPGSGLLCWGHLFFVQALPPDLHTPCHLYKAKPGHSFPPSLSLPCLGKALLVCRQDDSFLCHPLTPLGPSSCFHPLCAVRMEPSCDLCEALRHWISSRPSKAKRSRGLIRTDRRETGSSCPRAKEKIHSFC